VSTSFWSALIAPLIYLALFAFCSRDIRILDLAQVVGRRTPRTPNRLFWRTNSYGP
jgi:type IV secretion system protein VirB3